MVNTQLPHAHAYTCECVFCVSREWELIIDLFVCPACVCVCVCVCVCTHVQVTQMKHRLMQTNIEGAFPCLIKNSVRRIEPVSKRCQSLQMLRASRVRQASSEPGTSGQAASTSRKRQASSEPGTSGHCTGLFTFYDFGVESTLSGHCTSRLLKTTIFRWPRQHFLTDLFRVLCKSWYICEEDAR